VVGRRYAEMMAQRFPGKEKYLEKVLSTGHAVRFEREMDGRVYDHGIYPVLDEEGRVARVVVVVTDITERVRWQQRIARAERLAALGRLAATLAHEINNPLQAIQSHLELALDFPLSEGEQRRFLEVVRQEVARLSRVTQTVLHAARPSGTAREVVRVEDLVERVLGLIRLRAERKGIEVHVAIRDDLPALLVVPDEMVQVLLNLLTNAVDAAPEGGWLRIEGGRADGLVELRVVNSGPTIPPEHIARLFDPFFTTKPNGLGLGLPFSRQVVERYGGTIRVENLRDGEGVAFTVRLPAMSREGPEEEE
jgi:signal transduction histidine kinase